jgi:hypothetical protein
MAPTAYQSGVRASGAEVSRARPLRTIRTLHRIGDVMTRAIGVQNHRRHLVRIVSFVTLASGQF